MPIDFDSVRQASEAAARVLAARQLSQHAAEATEEAESQRGAKRTLPQAESEILKDSKKVKKEIKKKLKKKQKKHKKKKHKKREKKHKKDGKKYLDTSSSSVPSSASDQESDLEDQTSSRLVKPMVTCRTGAAEARLVASSVASTPSVQREMWPKKRAQEIIRDIAIQRIETEQQEKMEREAEQRKLDEVRSSEWRHQAEQRANKYLLSERRQELGPTGIADPPVEDKSPDRSFIKAKAKYDAAVASFERSDDMFAGLY